MKNLKGAICYSVAGIMSLLTVIWNVLPFVSMGDEGVSIYKVYTINGMATTLASAKAFSIIALILGCLCTVICVLGLLNNLGITDIKWLKIVGLVLVGLFVAAALLALILTAVECNEYVKVGAGLIMVLITSVVAAAGIIIAEIKSSQN